MPAPLSSRHFATWLMDIITDAFSACGISDRLCMVRLLQPGPQGYPLQVFCYTDTSVWKEYESIQADIFEHLAAVAPVFGLSIFTAPSSRSVYNVAQATPQPAPYNGGGAPLYTPSSQTSGHAQQG